MKNVLLFISLVTLILIGCTESITPKDQTIIKDSIDSASLVSPEVDEITDLVNESLQYTQNRDIDGDGISDFISFDYSGGAHCCYTLSLKLSSMKDTIHYPFEMDGGYGFGIVDGSNHDQFNIADYDNDGLPEIFLGHSTYNGEPYEIDKNWTKEYGIKTNYIIFDYINGKIELSDYDSLKYVIKHHQN